ncbi:MAG: hypothetical protein BWY53_00633 [Parcubacteria group bacterium ADurb.Bin326]|nr:MAG: hypothetical protein BWY53_00633 [Parcubacteria group bacterium ADurb.Bin326]
MKNAKKNNLKITVYLAALVIVIFFAAYFFYFPDLFLTSVDGDNSYTPYTRIIQVDKESLEDLDELKKCGDWPLNQINPSTDRGNPFASKKNPDEVMTAVSEVQCLSVIRN